MFPSLDILKSYNCLGERHLEDGTLLIGHAPHIAPQAWLHCIYPPLSDKELCDLENELNESMPDSYRLFLKNTNGLNVFNTTFNLYGLRKNYKRDVVSVWQPFDILTPNRLERPGNAKRNFLFIGSYNWDGSLLYIDRNFGNVHVCNRDDSTSLFQWANFDEMLDSEIKRVVTLFDDKGKTYNEDKSTLPF